MKKNLPKTLLIGALVLLFAIAWQRGWLNYLTLSELQAQLQGLRDWQQQQPGLAALSFVLIYLAVTAASLPGAAVLTLAGGAIFGLWWGTLLVSFASTGGATLAMLVSRYLLGNWVRQRYPERMKQVDSGVERDGPVYLFGLRMVPLFPFFVVNLLMGLTKIPVSQYWWVSQLGMLPATLVYVNVGTELASLTSLSGILSPTLLLAFALLGVLPWITRQLLAAYQRKALYKQWSKPQRFDRNLIVIGAGAGGLVSSLIASAVKAKVTLIEREAMGGDCLNTGCVPSKAILKSAQLAKQLQQAEHYGIDAKLENIDFAKVMGRVEDKIAAIEPHDSAERYESLGVEVIKGEAKLSTPWEVQIATAEGTKTLTSRSLIIATGAAPTIPDIPGLDKLDYLTSETLWQLRERPERLLVIGGGPIGCELSQVFARLGSQVTLVQRADRLLPREDADVAAQLTEQFIQEGIDVRLGYSPLRFEQGSEGYQLICQSGSEQLALGFDRLLLAVGRSARATGFGLEELGLDVEANKVVPSNQFLETRLPNILVCGDVAGPYQFTHVAAHQAWYASVNALFGFIKKFRADYRVIPAATFTEPEIARVGINEQEAAQLGIAVEVTRYDLADLDRAICDSCNKGFVKVLTPPGKDKILGATIVGPHSAELLSEFTLAMKHNLGLNKILGTVHLYPSYSEANKFAAGAWKRANAPEFLLPWLEKLHAWRRGE